MDSAVAQNASRSNGDALQAQAALREEAATPRGRAVDVIVAWPGESHVLVACLRSCALSGDFHLTALSKCDAQVWPVDEAAAERRSEWRCRFMPSRRSGPIEAAIPKLISAIGRRLEWRAIEIRKIDNTERMPPHYGDLTARHVPGLESEGARA